MGRYQQRQNALQRNTRGIPVQLRKMPAFARHLPSSAEFALDHHLPRGASAPSSGHTCHDDFSSWLRELRQWKQFNSIHIITSCHVQKTNNICDRGFNLPATDGTTGGGDATTGESRKSSWREAKAPSSSSDNASTTTFAGIVCCGLPRFLLLSPMFKNCMSCSVWGWQL